MVPSMFPSMVPTNVPSMVPVTTNVPKLSFEGVIAGFVILVFIILILAGIIVILVQRKHKNSPLLASDNIEIQNDFQSIFSNYIERDDPPTPKGKFNQIIELKDLDHN